MSTATHSTGTPAPAEPAEPVEPVEREQSIEPADVVDHLLGVRPGDRLDQLRAARPETRTHVQKAYEALLDPRDDSEFTRVERLAVATFVVGLHGHAELNGFYAERLAALSGEGGSAVVGTIEAETARGLAAGPYGTYREPGLAAESVGGPVYRAAEEAVLGTRLTAALEHAHLLVLRPREATPEALARLLDAGWSTTGIVTLSQLVAFLAFQVRLVHGLRQLADVRQGAR